MTRIKLNLAILFAIIIGVSFVGCEKEVLNTQKEEEQNADVKTVAQIKNEAVKFSDNHDALIYKLLEAEAIKLEEKKQKTKNKNATLDGNDLLDVIEEVIGVRPMMINNNYNTGDATNLNLDLERISLSDYAKTEIEKKYLNFVDAIIQNEQLTILEKVKEINKIQDDIINDSQASASDIENILTSTEVLKGSIKLWSEKFGYVSNQKGNPYNWALWKKILFVATADAVGGVIGYFVGGVIIIDGQSLYIPPPIGGVALAVAFSYIAGRFVGW